MATLRAGPPPCMQPPTGTVTLKEFSGKYSPDPIHAFNKSGRHLEFLIYDVIRGKASVVIFKF